MYSLIRLRVQRLSVDVIIHGGKFGDDKIPEEQIKAPFLICVSGFEL
jgi:hypothetical protein